MWILLEMSKGSGEVQLRNSRGRFWCECAKVPLKRLIDGFWEFRHLEAPFLAAKGLFMGSALKAETDGAEIAQIWAKGSESKRAVRGKALISYLVGTQHQLNPTNFNLKFLILPSIYKFST